MSPSPQLRCAARYSRTVQASLERVWENVLDWEHLPWLHPEAFAAVELLDRGAWGWRARVGSASKRGVFASVVEVRIDRTAHRYVSATVEGAGAGSEIWTQLTVLDAHRTGVDVEFWVPPIADVRAARAGESLVRTYVRLWDQDEAMMARRTSEIEARREISGGAAEVVLGTLASLRARMPLCVTAGGRPWRIVELDGEIVVYGTRCPHLLGPLEHVDAEAGHVTCPWHGYRFDVRSGASLDGRALTLDRSARVYVDSVTTEVVLRTD